MRRLIISFALATLCLASNTTRADGSGPIKLDWSTINAGGGTSSGGRFALSGTIGQPDAGILSGGSLKLEGGFWSSVTVLQSPGTPLLKIILLPGNQARLSWPIDASGFMLEATSSVGSGVWSTT